MSMLRHLVISAVLVLVSVTPVMAQVGTQGSILGAVVDSSQRGAARRHGRRHEPRHGSRADRRHRRGGQLRDPGAADRPLLGDRVDARLQDVAARAARPDRRRAQPRRRRVLEVGNITEQVTVVGGAPLLQTERSSVQTVVRDEADSRAAAQHAQSGGARQPGAGHAVHRRRRSGARLHGAGLRHARRTRPSSSWTA